MTHRRRFAFAASALSVTAAASGCPSDLPTVLSLTSVPGEIRGVEHVLQVSVQDDDCLRVQRPAHWHPPGRFGGVLAAPSPSAAEDSRGEAFAVLGADRSVLRWTDYSGLGHEGVSSGAFQYAERHHDRVDLAAVASLVSMRRAEAERDDRVDLAAAP